MVREDRSHTACYNHAASIPIPPDGHSPARADFDRPEAVPSPVEATIGAGQRPGRERSAPGGTDRAQVVACSIVVYPTFLAADLVASTSALTALRMLVAAAFT
jgi:hypothetical protein